jgi:hypothetical protein
MTTPLAFVLFIVVVALIFDFANARPRTLLHRSINRVLSPGIAVMWAAYFSDSRFGTRSKTIGGDMIDIGLIGGGSSGCSSAIDWCDHLGRLTWYWAPSVRLTPWSVGTRRRNNARLAAGQGLEDYSSVTG